MENELVKAENISVEKIKGCNLAIKGLRINTFINYTISAGTGVVAVYADQGIFVNKMYGLVSVISFISAKFFHHNWLKQEMAYDVIKGEVEIGAGQLSLEETVEDVGGLSNVDYGGGLSEYKK